MLYVFHVDVGRMLNFDMTVALSSVENLKDTIERLHGIPAANIVLLVSGGEMLTHSTQVSYYSAGTDTNPIYMFLTGDVKVSPVGLPLDSADFDLREQVDRSLELPVANETVLRRAQLAMRMFELARDEDRLCERLVHEQHLQQQGWSAVVANMEDLTNEFRQRFQSFCEIFERHLEKRADHVHLLKHFGDDLEKLSRIPILPGLMTLVDADFHVFDDFLDHDEVLYRTQHQATLVEATRAGAITTTTTSNSSNNRKSSIAATEAKEVSKAPLTILINTTASDKIIVEEVGNALQNVNTGDNGVGSLRSGEEKLLMLTTTTAVTTTNVTVTTTCATTGVIMTSMMMMMADDIKISDVSSNALYMSSSNSVYKRRLNLLQWITSKQNHNVLKTMSDECIQGLSTFNDEIYEKLKIEVQNIIKVAEQSDVKEIKGLGERLCKLEEIKYKIKNMVRDQKELSTSIQQNQNRFKDLRDTSILPDLCESHRSQLIVMLQNYQKIRDHRRLIAKAKDELGSNLHTRLKRIVFIENAMSEFDNSLLFYRRCLGRAERHIHIIEQIHQTPSMYVDAVTEVLRRKIFSNEFRLWASKLAEDFNQIHGEEVNRRQEFNEKFKGHFLNILFPGMQDMPPAFTNENPPLIFDASLPNITHCDIDLLNTHLPEITARIKLPNMDPVIYFFVSRSGSHQKERLMELEGRQGEEKHSTVLQSARLLEQRKEMSGKSCDDSETDTETEFEQLPRTRTQDASTSMEEDKIHDKEEQRKEMLSKSTITDQSSHGMVNVSTLTDQNDETIRSEVQCLRELLNAMSKLALICIQNTRKDLSSLHQETLGGQRQLLNELSTIKENWLLLNREYMNSEEKHHRIVIDLQQQIQQLNAIMEEKNQASENHQKVQYFKAKCTNLKAELEECLKSMQNMQEEKDIAVNEVREVTEKYENQLINLQREWQVEREKLLQQRERDRTPENYIERKLHETILAQQYSDYEEEKEKAIKDALHLERSIWQTKMFPLNPQSMIAQVNVLHVLEEKERQLDQLREKDLMLTKENYQLKTRVDALTNEEGNSWLREKIEYLNRDKCRLEEELNMEKLKRIDMERGLSHEQQQQQMSNTMTSSTSTLARSKSMSSGQKHAVLESCGKGDIVFVVWNMRHCQYMVVQQSPNLYFVHGESLPGLNLHLPATEEQPIASSITNTPCTLPQQQISYSSSFSSTVIPMPFYALGRVVEKEYCQARKEENRYRVVRGSKFYRIKLAPIALCSSRLSGSNLRRDRCDLSSSSILSINRPVSQCKETQTTNSSAADAAEATMVIGRAVSSNPSGKRVLTGLGSHTMDTGNVGKDIRDGSATSPKLSCKERAMSFSSVAEEDEEPVSLLSDRCRYISVSEEDETAITTTNQATVQQHEQQSVITEQPTSSVSDRKLQLDLMLASKDISELKITTTETSNTNNPPDSSVDIHDNTAPSRHHKECEEKCPSVTQSDEKTAGGMKVVVSGDEEEESGQLLSLLLFEQKSKQSTTTKYSSEDSDEYRSLEAKDDGDFSISE